MTNTTNPDFITTTMTDSPTRIPDTGSRKKRIALFSIIGAVVGALAAFPLTLALIAGDPSSTAAILLVLTVPFGLVVGAIIGGGLGAALRRR